VILLANLSKNVRAFLGFQTVTEDFASEDGVPNEGGVGSGWSSVDYSTEISHIQSFFSEIRGYISDLNIESNMSYYYRQYCGKFGISENEYWSGVLTVLSDDGNYVLGIIEFTYQDYHFYMNEKTYLGNMYVVVIDYEGFIHIESQFRSFADGLTAMENPEEAEVINQAIA